MKKKNIVVAVLAYNEQENIVRVLREVLMQRRNNFDLKEIWIVSDGSKDKTVRQVRALKNKKIKIFDYKTNRGKIYRFNQVAAHFRDDILLQLDADITIKHKNTFEKLIQPFYEDTELAISCAYHIALKPVSLAEKLAHFGFRVWDTARKDLGASGERYYCEGGLRAFSRKFLHGYKIPTGKPMSEDSYSFYYAKSKDLRTKNVLDSKVYFKLPDNYKDYLKQMRRFLTNGDILEKQFGKALVTRYETITLKVKFFALLKCTSRSPFTAFCYIILQFTAKISALYYRPKVKWDVAQSTKNIASA